MLRSPLEALDDHRWQTVGVVVLLAAALWMAAATAASLQQLEAASQGWFEAFVPAVYLEADVEDRSVETLVEELEDWSGVRGVDVEDPEIAYRRLEEQLGAREVRDLEIDERMMPVRVVVRPETWRPGTVDLVARVEALEERDHVVAVDVPSAEVGERVDRIRMVLFGTAAVVAVALLGALASLVLLLRRLQRSERREHHLLEVFGASPASLRRVSLWRGMFVGAVAGLVAAVAFVAWSLVVDELIYEWAGHSAMTATRSALWGSALIGLGVVSAGAVGWLFGGPGGDEETESMLEWQRDES